MPALPCSPVAAGTATPPPSPWPLSPGPLCQALGNTNKEDAQAGPAFGECSWELAWPLRAGGHGLYPPCLWEGPYDPEVLLPLPHPSKSLGCGDLVLICVTSDHLPSSEAQFPLVCDKGGELRPSAQNRPRAQSEAGGARAAPPPAFHRSQPDAPQAPKALQEPGTLRAASPCALVPPPHHLASLTDKATPRLLWPVAVCFLSCSPPNSR